MQNHELNTNELKYNFKNKTIFKIAGQSIAFYLLLINAKYQFSEYSFL